MAERFRKLIKLAPGTRLTRRGSGMAWRAGQKNATVGIGKRCPVLAAGKAAPVAKAPPPIQALPGAAGARQVIGIQISLEVNDQGLASLRDPTGATLAEPLASRIKTLRSEEVKLLMQKKCDAINRQIESLGELHIYTPPPDTAPTFDAERFTLPRPKPPTLRARGFFAFLFKSVALQIAEYNSQAVQMYEAASARWETARTQHEAQQADAREVFDRTRMGDTGAMERLLEMKLAAIVWPCELLVTISISADGTRVMMDTSLPDLEDMPTNFAIAPVKGLQLDMVAIPQSQVRYMYMRLVHAIGFRLVGEVFANLQAVNEVVMSAYVPFENPETGEIKDQFTYSVAVRRPEWRKVGFTKIRGIDIVSAFGSFAFRRGMAKAGVFKSIKPFDRFPESAAEAYATESEPADGEDVEAS